MITWENYEEYMMMHADGELHPDEVQALMAFVSQHPELNTEMAAYDLTRLVPDTTEIFANKEALLKPLPAKRVIALPVWGRYSIAAGVAALICLSVWEHDNNEAGNVAVNTVDTGKTNTSVAITAAPSKTNTGTAKDTDKIELPAAIEKKALAAHTVNQATNKEKESKNSANSDVKKEEETMLVRNTETISKLAPVDIKRLPNDKVAEQAVAMTTVPPYTIQAPVDPAEATFWDRLPIEERNKKQLKDVAGFVADTYQKVTTAKQEIADKTIAIKIEKKHLIITF